MRRYGCKRCHRTYPSAGQALACRAQCRSSGSAKRPTDRETVRLLRSINRRLGCLVLALVVVPAGLWLLDAALPTLF